MNYQFRKHYTREEAEAMLPQVRQWLTHLDHLKSRVQEYDKRIIALMEPGCDVGGETVNEWVRTLSAMRDLLLEFQTRDIIVKDLQRGLVDFPAIIGDKEVFLCWENGEDKIEFWHDLDTGYAGREKL